MNTDFRNIAVKWSDFYYLKPKGKRGEYLHRPTGATFVASWFDRIFSDRLSDAGEYTPQTGHYGVKNNLIKRVYGVVVDATTDSDTVYDENSNPLYNKFKREHLPVPDKEYTDAGTQAIQKFLEHIEFVCGGSANKVNTKDYHRMLYWFAHLVQRPSVPLGWYLVLDDNLDTLTHILLPKLLRSEYVSNTSYEGKDKKYCMQQIKRSIFSEVIIHSKASIAKFDAFVQSNYKTQCPGMGCNFLVINMDKDLKSDFASSTAAFRPTQHLPYPFNYDKFYASLDGCRFEVVNQSGQILKFLTECDIDRLNYSIDANE